MTEPKTGTVLSFSSKLPDAESFEPLEFTRADSLVGFSLPEAVKADVEGKIQGVKDRMRRLGDAARFTVDIYRSNLEPLAKLLQSLEKPKHRNPKRKLPKRGRYLARQTWR